MTKSTQTNEKARREPEYTLEDIGCYVDGSRGVYAIDAIIHIAKAHGWQGTNETRKMDSLSDYEFADEVENIAEQFMNSDYGVCGAYWGRNEQGDWGLWANDNE